MKRLLRNLLGMFVVLALVLGSGMLWLTTSASGLRTLASLAGNASNGRLQLQEAAGSLSGPLQFGHLRWHDGELLIEAENITLDWSPHALLSGRLDIAQLTIDRLHVNDRSAASNTSLPAHLNLPLAVNLEKLAISDIVLNEQTIARDITAQLSSDGRLHRLSQLTARLDAGQVKASAQLDGVSPFAVDAAADLSGDVADHPLQLKLAAAGPLARLPLRLLAEGSLQGNGEITLTPLSTIPFADARIVLKGLDPAVWQAGAPRAALDVFFELQPRGDALSGSFDILNRQPGQLDRQRLPIQHLRGRLQGRLPSDQQAQGKDAAGALELAALDLQLAGQGRLQGSGRWQAGQLHLDLNAQHLDAASLLSSLRATAFKGTIQAELGASRQRLALDLADPRFTLQAHAVHASEHLSVSRLELGAGNARLSAQGELAFSGERAFRVEGQLRQFDPARFISLPSSRLPAANINARLDARGRLSKGAPVEGRFEIADSRFAGQPLSGNGQILATWPTVSRAEITLAAGPNQLRGEGAFGRVGDRLQLQINAPQLGLLGLPEIAGSLQGRLELRGSLEHPTLSSQLSSPQLSLPGPLRLRDAEILAEVDSNPLQPESPLRLQLRLARLTAGAAASELRDLKLDINGRNAAHQLRLSGSQGQHQFALLADGGFSGALREGRWQGRLLEASLTADTEARNFRLSAPSPLAIGPERWQFGPASLQGAPLDWQAKLEARADDKHLNVRLNGRGSRVGQLEGELEATMNSAWSLAENQSWRGRLRTDIADLSWLGELIGDSGPGLWQTGGRLHGEATLSGTPQLPRLNGRWQGERLALALPEQGLQLTDGSLSATLADDRLRVEGLGFNSLLRPPPRALRLAEPETLARLTAQPGRLDISGEMAFDPSGAAADRAALDIRLERVGAWQTGDQWILVSGDARLNWQSSAQDSGFGLRGKLAADAGYWQLAPGGAPRLSDDVVIRRRSDDAGKASAATLRPTLELDLAVDIGRLFLFNGSGLSARLDGDLKLTARGRDLPRATGSIRTRDARFSAYGQQLAIERGILNFQGLLDNPALDVRAVRKGLAVEPGVQISGNARRPVIRLISDPELPDTEKLAWLVLGHGPEQMGAGDATVLLGAAGGLLGNDSGNIVQQLKTTFGIDELGVRQGDLGGNGGRMPASRVAGSSVNTAASTGNQIFSVGKRLSANALLSYEQSIGRAEGIVKLTVNLNRNLALIGRAGSDNAIDLFYTFAFGRPPNPPGSR